MKRIIVISKDRIATNKLKKALISDGHRVLVLNDYSNEVPFLNTDIVLLDSKVLFNNKELILQNIRRKTNVPIIVLMRKNSTEDQILALQLGADDYITKPYDIRLLLLKISAIARRYKATTPILNYKDLEINRQKGIIKKENELTLLTKNEMIILNFLLNNKNRIVAREEIMTDLWLNNEYINDNALTVNISRLRGKLKELGHKDMIETRKGLGYILTE